MRYAGIIILLFLFLSGAAQAQKSSVSYVDRSFEKGIFLFLSGEAQEQKGSVSYVERSFEEELILSVRLKNYILSEGIIAYQHQTGVLLPLGEMMSALEFAIDVNPRTGIADGWFLRENRSFFLDAVKGELTILGEKQSYQKELVELHSDDIYVDSLLLSEWFPVDADVALSLSRVIISSREPLPLEERLEREKNQGRLGKGGQSKEIPLPPLFSPYSLFSTPGIDVYLLTGYQDTNGGKSYDGSYNLFFAGDLLYMTGNIFVAGSKEDALGSLRMTLERKDSNGGLTPLGLSEITIGDVFTPSIPLMVNSKSGRGVRLTNFPMEAIREFDRITLRDDLPIGWEVELYRNDSLIDAQTTPDENGRYEFENVSLLFGKNVLKLMFYGPQGQRREEVHTYNVGNGATPRGKHFFSLAVNQQDKDVFNSINENSGAIADPDDGKLRGVFEYQTGLTKRISLKADVSSVYLDGQRENFTRLGLLTSVFGAFTEVNAVSLIGGGHAAEIATQFDFLGLNTNIFHEHFFPGFFSEEIQSGNDPVRDRTKLSFNGAFSLLVLPRLSYGLDLGYEKRESGEALLDFSNRLSGSIKGVSFTNNLTGQKALNTTSDSDLQLSGAFLLNTSDVFDIETLSLRGSMNYTIEPEQEFTSVSLTSDYDLNEDTGVRFGVNLQIAGEKAVNYSAGLNRDFDAFAVSVDSSYNDHGDFSIFMALNFSFDLKSKGEMSHFSRDKGAGEGVVLSRIFLDNNSNRIFDEGDEPVEGAQLNIGGRSSEEESSEGGFVRVGNLSAHRPVNVSLDARSLPDPYWISTVEGNQIIPRPGKVTRMNFPVSTTGEIDGTVYMGAGGKLKEIASVRIQLLDEKGGVIRTEKTAFDGFYLFLNVLPGKYTLRIEPEQLNKLGILAPGNLTAEIEKDGSILNGFDFYLAEPKS